MLPVDANDSGAVDRAVAVGARHRGTFLLRTGAGRRGRRSPTETELLAAIAAFDRPLDAWVQELAALVPRLFDDVAGVHLAVESSAIGIASATVGELRGDTVGVPLLVSPTTRGQLLLSFGTSQPHALSRYRARVTLAVVALENALHLRCAPDAGTLLEQATHADWQALVDARSSLARRDGELVVIPAPPCSVSRRRLVPADVLVARAILRGDSYKQIADELSCSTGSVSRILSNAAAKLGVLPVDLLHVAAALGGERSSIVREAALTEAERDVLGLLRQGLSNAAIARLRARSERTVANQVSSLLRKTRTSSRRALAAARSVV